MSHYYILCSSATEIYNRLEEHINKANTSNALGNKYDIIPSNLITQIELLHSGQKFKDCKDFCKKLIQNESRTDSGTESVLSFREVLFDGNINDLNAIFESEASEESLNSSNSKTFWVLRIPTNTLITSYLPKKNKVTDKSSKYMTFVKDLEGKKRLIGVAESYFYACKLVEESSGMNISKSDSSHILKSGEEQEIKTDVAEYVIRKL